MRNKGFTLIELLAVIVVLGIIMIIAVAAVSSAVNNSKVNSFKNDARILIKNIDYNMSANMDNPTYDVTTINQSNMESKLGVSSINYQTLETNLLRGKVHIIIQGQNSYNNLIAYGTYDTMQVVGNSAGTYNSVKNQLTYDNSSNVNVPQLSKGMVPIKWDGQQWVSTLESDPDWYNYTQKKWANAMTVDGSMWVWIPRYIYKISTGWHTNTAGTIEVQFSKGIDDNWNSGTIGTINTGTTSSASNNTWTNHPAFTFGSTELTGIWVAKFEATAAEGVDNDYDDGCGRSNDDVSTKTVKSVPNALSWRCLVINNAFLSIRNMETKVVYGWSVASGLQANGNFSTDTNNINTHLMKNTEWGAVTYLSKSNYGKGTNEVYINNSQTFTTGCGGDTASAGIYNGCQNTYETSNGVKASTSGTIYGVYDMNGGADEYMAAYLNNGNASLNNGLAIINALSQYKNSYTLAGTDDSATNYGLSSNYKGDAVYETSNNYGGACAWFNDYASMPVTSNPWVIRGGNSSIGANAGLYKSYLCSGNCAGNSFRPVLLVRAGL